MTSPRADGPIGVFDSGVGGLTVLDECLAALPAEDFVYFGDTAWFPYGEHSVEELRVRALAIGRWLVASGAKLVVVACNTAAAAALDALQRELPVAVIGVMAPEARAAAQATRNRRVGLLATTTTVRSGSYERMIHANDAGVTVTSVACPELAPAIQRGDPVDEAFVDLVRGYVAPLIASDVDTCILGCTHYPVVERLIRRSMPGVTLIASGEEIVREMSDSLRRKGLLRPLGHRGEYRFSCSGDPAAFSTVGARFMQLPLGEVEQIDPERATAATS